MSLHTIQTRFLLWSLGLLMAALGIVFVVAPEAVNTDLEHEAIVRAKRELSTIKWLILHHTDFETEQQLDTWVENMGTRLGTRVTFISNGRVVADSMVSYPDLPNLDDHSQRPEVAGATASLVATSQRYSDTLNCDMIYAAMQLPSSTGLPRSVLRVAVPVSEISARIDSLRFNFLILFMVVLAAAGLLLLAMTRSVSKSILAFSGAVKDIGDGDFNRRIREVPAKEFQPLANSVNIMAGRIQEHIAIIEDQQGQLKAMFEGLSEGVLILDSFGRIESFNHAMSTFFPQIIAYIGRAPLEATMNLAVQDAVERILDAPESGLAEAEIEIKNGLHLAVSVVPFVDRKDIRKLVLVFHDVTETRRGERMLRDFVANASHQLRTPLTSIKGYAETLIASPPDDPGKVKDFLATIERNATHMSEVVSSLLALAKSEQLKRTQSRPVDACLVLRQAAANLAPHAAQNKMHIEIEIPSEPVFVRADAEGLLHVFHNLIDNATKYGPQGTTITLKATLLDNIVTFFVCDHGDGIAEKHRERIFERFYRVDTNAISGDGSAGLGLAICRQIVENFGGKIACLSPDETPGNVTCFRFTLKAAPLTDTGSTPDTKQTE